MEDLLKFQEEIAEADKISSQKAKNLTAKYKGVKIEIICPHFNDQLYGRSKPKLKGKTFNILNVDYYHRDVFIKCEGLEMPLELGQVKIA